ncbi:pilus assembly protein [Sphaerotilus microaerophilus]|uniref:PilY1 beta-propeller domain-containing protein n=1 Tax=Sphaerotilus microaerophilus TaxID=2914710 RepID=A0ABN6PUD5_9BURK|nr:PilC/PilY family type IV pilus protein [Sphaerotilus sp. FB-5]BDI08057.1 hypothetical protein CATMQ487_50270 [Sphaerotilus sp. FB-5]
MKFLSCWRRHPRKTWAITLAVLGWAVFQVSFALDALDEQPVGHVAPLEFSKYDLSRGGAVAFRGDHVRATWDGDLMSYDVSTTGTVTSKWSGARQLALASWDTGRKIFTCVSSGAGVRFRWTDGISAAQQTALGDATTGPKVLNYLRGDGSNELTEANPGGLFRQRTSRIGAVVHGRPHYFEHGRNADGDPIGRVYVGANDGMLHAFDAATGAEVFAYVPSMLFPKLKDLAATPAAAYKYYVDGPLAIAQLPASGATTTLLVGALGAGAKGLYALDVSNPSPADEAAATGMAKWEITEATTGFQNLAHVYGAPQFVKLNNGRRALLVPNGINSTAGISSLFVVDPVNGTLIAEIGAGTGPGNGLGGVAAVDLDGNGTVDVAYAGDLRGTLWKFNLRGSSLPSAAVALYTPPADVARPITAAPSVSAHPRGGVMVNFGTGRLLSISDSTSTADEYLYGIWDSPLATAAAPTRPTLTTASKTIGTTTIQVRVASADASNTVDYANGSRGWRLTLTGGERVLGTDTFTENGRFIVTTTIPNGTDTPTAWMLQVDALTGSMPTAPFFDLNGDGTVSTSGDSDRVSATVNGVTMSVPPAGRLLGTGAWSQPALIKLDRYLDVPYFNHNSNVAFPTTSTQTVTTPSSTERGVYGGHFDFDIFYNVCNPLATSQTYRGTCASNTHVHEYDDKYDVVGVNLLNASRSAFNLGNAIASMSTAFKILVANTRWSPAARLMVGNAEYRVWDLPLSPEGFIAATPGGAALTFTRASVGNLVFKLPIDAFTAREWVPGSGDTRAGLIPTKTGCVRDNTGNQGSQPGPWMNGALTVMARAGHPG